jgi:hypothetical protein
MEYLRNLPDTRMVNTHRAMDSELLQTRKDLLHNRQVLRSKVVVRNGFSLDSSVHVDQLTLWKRFRLLYAFLITTSQADLRTGRGNSKF